MNPSRQFVDRICQLYGDSYDDREEDSSPGGLDWKPGQKSMHKSLGVFQRELDELGIKLTTGKIKKILITGGCWTTERTREVQYLYEQYTEKKENGGQGLSHQAAVDAISSELELSVGMICMSLPYNRVVYTLDDKSSNAKRCDRSRQKRKIAASNVPKSEVECLDRAHLRN
jgi:hypothetical protein